MKAVLLSHVLSRQTPVYQGTLPVMVAPLRRIDSGDSSNTWALAMGNHVGTHVDAPRHFYDDGRAISNFAIEELIFERATIIDVPKGPGELVTKEDLEVYREEISSVSFIMVRTGIEELREKDPKTFAYNGPCFSAEAARYLASFHPGLRGLGTDSISIGSPRHREEGRGAHRILLALQNFLIVEDMALAGKVSRYDYVIVAPLMIEEVDSAPCTVIGLYDVL